MNSSLKTLGMFEIKGWYFPVKDTHAASIRANQTIYFPEWWSLLDGIWWNCYAELAADLTLKKKGLQTLVSEFQCILYVRELFMKVWGIPTLYLLINSNRAYWYFSPSPFLYSLKLMSSPVLSITAYLYTTFISWHASYSIHTHHEPLPGAVLPPATSLL